MLREEGPGDRQRQSMGLITANHFCVFSLFPQPMDPPPILVLSLPSTFRPFLSTRVPAILLHLYSCSPYHPLFSSHHSLRPPTWRARRRTHAPSCCRPRSVSFSYSCWAPRPQTRWTRQSASGRPSSTAGAPTWCTGRTSSTTTASRSAAQTCDPGGGGTLRSRRPARALAVYILFI